MLPLPLRSYALLQTGSKDRKEILTGAEGPVSGFPKLVPERDDYGGDAEYDDHREVDQLGLVVAVKPVVEPGHKRTDDQQGNAAVVQPETPPHAVRRGAPTPVHDHRPREDGGFCGKLITIISSVEVTFFLSIFWRCILCNGETYMHFLYRYEP